MMQQEQPRLGVSVCRHASTFHESTSVSVVGLREGLGVVGTQAPPCWRRLFLSMDPRDISRDRGVSWNGASDSQKCGPKLELKQDCRIERRMKVSTDCLCTDLYASVEAACQSSHSTTFQKPAHTVALQRAY